MWSCRRLLSGIQILTVLSQLFFQIQHGLCVLRKTVDRFFDYHITQANLGHHLSSTRTGSILADGLVNGGNTDRLPETPEANGVICIYTLLLHMEAVFFLFYKPQIQWDILCSPTSFGLFYPTFKKTQSLLIAVHGFKDAGGGTDGNRAIPL